MSVGIFLTERLLETFPTACAVSVAVIVVLTSRAFNCVQW